GTIIKDGPNSLTLTNVTDGNAILNAGNTIVTNAAGGANVNSRIAHGGTVTINNGATLTCRVGNPLGLGSGNLPASFMLNTGGTIYIDSSSDTSIYNGTFAGGIISAASDFSSLTFRGDYATAAGTSSTVTVPGPTATGFQNAV